MQIPTKKTCYELIRDMAMLDHIVAHSIQVTRVALLLTDKINAAGSSLNRDLIQASALLHDITKTRSFKTGELHSETGCRLLNDKGYSETASIVRQHVNLDIYFTSEFVTEAEIVNYADKRVLHDRIVPMEERMQYILDTYGKNKTKMDLLLKLWENSKLVEKRIFKNIPIEPRDLESLLGHDGYASELTFYKSICNV
jgi:putative nucleotidyltransferase with HDIG domain